MDCHGKGLNVLVTGSSGFIGKRLVRRLMRESNINSITCVSRRPPSAHPLFSALRLAGLPTLYDAGCDLGNEQRVRLLLDRARPDIIFHLAGRAVVDSPHDELLAANVLSTYHLLEHCPEAARFVLASSATVYGDCALWATEQQRATPTSVYGATKAASEALVEAYTALGRARGVSLRLVANVGPGASHGLVRDIICKLSSDSTHLELLGDAPGSSKPYMYVEDTVEAFVHFGLNMAENGPVNIASDDHISVEEVAGVVMEQMGIHKPIAWLGSQANWKGDNRLVCLSSYKARQLGWRPSYADSAGAIRAALGDLHVEMRR